MAVLAWEDRIKNRNPKVLTIFPTAKIVGAWRTAFDGALREFNRLSKQHKLGVTFAESATAPDPDNQDGADVQFDLGNGPIAIDAFGNHIEATHNGRPINFSPVDLHGLTLHAKRNGLEIISRAFIFVPEKPTVSAQSFVGPGPGDFTDIPRTAGPGIFLCIAVHELIHACGLSNDEHTTGRTLDVFSSGLTADAGSFDRPEQDKIVLHLGRPNVFEPPITLGTTTAGLIRRNWS